MDRLLASGARGRLELIERHGHWLHIKPSHIETGRPLVRRATAPPAVFFSRMLPIVRTFISLPAGVAKMPFGRFTLFTLLGCIPWVLALALAGEALGSNWKDVRKYFEYVDYVVLALIVVGVVAWIVRRRRSQS